MKKFVDLHIHLGGAYPLEYLREISTRKDFKELVEDLEAVKFREADYNTIFSFFNKVEKIIDNESKLYAGVWSLVKKLSDSGIIYSEIRAGLKDLGKGNEAYLEAILNALESTKGKYDNNANLLVGVKRNTFDTNIIEALKLANKYQEKGIVGIDLSGKEAQGDLKRIKKLINLSKNVLPITAHIGEVSGLVLEDLIAIHPARVSHAINISQEIKDFLHNNRIPIELCISSNLYTNIIKTIAQHPFTEYYRNGFEIAVCSDDPLIFQTDIIKENKIFRESLNLTDEEILHLTKKAIGYSFAAPELKKELLTLL